MKEVTIEEINKAKKNIRNYNLEDYFGKEWLDSHLEIEERKNKHPIFWVLITGESCFTLSQDLDILKSQCNKYSGYITKLKENDEQNFHSAITETEVISHYYRNYNSEDITCEPIVEINGAKKKPDLKVTINGTDFFIEILTIFEDAIELKKNEINEEVKNKINEINQPFYVSFCTFKSFETNDIDNFINFIQDLLSDISSIEEDEPYYFEVDGIKKSMVKFEDMDLSNGFVGHIDFPVRTLNTTMRIKNKVLDKAEKQLPANNYNVVVIKLKDYYASSDQTDVKQAFYGQNIAVLDENFDLESIKRSGNGIIDHSKGQNLSLLIAYKHDFKDRKFYLNPNAQKIVNESIENKL